MPREYFITLPLILASSSLKFRQCEIHLRGRQGYSYIEGPSPDEIEEAFDFIHAIQDVIRVVGLNVQLRGPSQKEEVYIDPYTTQPMDWIRWAFTQIPLESIPVITLGRGEHEAIQKEIDSYK